MIKNYILGINLPIKSRCHESGVVLIDEDGKVLFAINEERLSRKKLDGDFPEKSIAAMLEYTGVKKEDIKYVAVPTLTMKQKFFRLVEYSVKERWQHFFQLNTYKTLLKYFLKEKNVGQIKGEEKAGFKMRYYWRDFIKQNFPQAEIMEVDHHICHGAGAYFTSPWPNALIMTIDGAGNWLTSIVAEGKQGIIKVMHKTFMPHSLGSFWGSITKVCGFASGTRHGGKVTGLAARGDKNKFAGKLREIVKARGMGIWIKEEMIFDAKEFAPSWNNYKPERMREYLGADATREDIAAGAQTILEEVVIEMVKTSRKKINCDKIVLAGGVFANVLLNQKILQLPEINDIYIVPPMSDGGLALGGALYCLSQLKIKQGERLLPQAIPNAYLGLDYPADEIEKTLNANQIKYKKMKNSAQEVAKILNDGKVVALCQGRMEYGPRALGNRSILYRPDKPEVNDWLNKKLQRSEFMPFAPVTMVEHIKENYIDIVSDPLAAKYMTVTYHCTDKMKHDASATVHIDGTARPQVVSRDINPYYYDILNEYYKLSGIPTLVNTSFNMHEEPIVCSPYDAIRAFLAAELDYLVIENYLCAFEDNKERKMEVLAK